MKKTSVALMTTTLVAALVFTSALPASALVIKSVGARTCSAGVHAGAGASTTGAATISVYNSPSAAQSATRPAGTAGSWKGFTSSYQSMIYGYITSGAVSSQTTSCSFDL